MYIHLLVHASSTLVQDGLADEWSTTPWMRGAPQGVTRRLRRHTVDQIGVTIGTNATPCAKGSRDCVITNQTDSYGVLGGYDAGSGYDLATGLGSPDAFNLINANGWANTISTPDFTVSSANSVVTVSAPGNSGTLTFTIASTNGFSGTFNIGAGSCSAMPTGSSCSFSPNNVTISQANPAATVTLTVKTASPSAFSIPTSQHHNRDSWATRELVLLAWIFCIGFLLLDVCRSQARRLAAFVLLVVGFVTAVEGCGCGSGGNNGGGVNGGTPAGTTNAVITLTSGAITHSLVFTINVQ